DSVELATISGSSALYSLENLIVCEKLLVIVFSIVATTLQAGKNQQPLSVIADDGFIELMKEAIPNYKLPSKKAIKILLL
ncbi:12569_t:CDS:2, partial [Dentiscutata heterogama]